MRFINCTKYLLVFFSFWMLASCEFSNERHVLSKVSTAFQQSYFDVTNRRPERALYMVIPRAGCSGCISSAESFMLECLKDSSIKKKIAFVLTNFDSQKIIKARFGTYLTETANIVIDSNDVFTKNSSLRSIYPVIYYLDKDGAVSSVNEVSPAEDGIANASNYLHKN